MGSTRCRGGRHGSAASGRCRMPAVAGGPPHTTASYRFCTALASNARPSAALAAAVRAITSRPEVSRSSRCTASAGPYSARSMAATQGGSRGVRAGTLGMPAGLSTTITSVSANRTRKPNADGEASSPRSDCVTTHQGSRPTPSVPQPARHPLPQEACLPKTQPPPAGVGRLAHASTPALHCCRRAPTDYARAPLSRWRPAAAATHR